ncbi:hypothetical protein F5X68DRAFT_16559 [Plectosphaerella plurivora]|uniref:WSC domain-containing protein n=1 Tax=Plectosphaerella plurivora TaxID=936078 RepID=A0A9P8V9U9_9PEZI|nr:hypothetical protein F5X68DRAFT_16559 [Plectosphaerella plurivora]
MDHLPRTIRLLGVSALLWPLWAFSYETAELYPRQQQGLTQDLCSTINTGSGAANLSQWQTLGLCRDFCIAKDTAFAVVQWQSCWCSDVEPGEDITTSVSSCSDGCPGYGDVESCGRRPNLYGYFRLPKQPVSTQGASTTAQSSTSTTQNTVTVIPSPSTAPSSSTQPSPSSSEEQSTRVTQSTISADGTVRTIFITPTNTPPDVAGSESSADGNAQTGSGGLGTGAVVGIVIGVIAAVLAVAGALLFWFFRRRKQQKANGYEEPNSSQRGSSSGMIASTRNPEMIVTSDNQGAWASNSASEQRRSRLMAVDPRMDPHGRPMFLRNKSHESVNTLHDDQDYSRKVAKPVLRATNPDPLDD